MSYLNELSKGEMAAQACLTPTGVLRALGLKEMQQQRHAKLTQELAECEELLKLLEDNPTLERAITLLAGTGGLRGY